MLNKDPRNVDFFGKVALNIANNTKATMNDRTTFYGLLFANTKFPPKKMSINYWNKRYSLRFSKALYAWNKRLYLKHCAICDMLMIELLSSIVKMGFKILYQI
jgi:hypothetical protein